MILKNKNIFLLSFLLIITYNNAKADTKDSIDIKKKNICIIKYVPTDLASLDGFFWDGGYLNYGKISLETDFHLISKLYLGTKLSKAISYGRSVGSYISIYTKSTNGYQLELNSKYFLLQLKNNLNPYTGFYVSLAATYMNTTTIREEGYFKNIHEYKVNRDIYSYKFLIGYQKVNKLKIVFDHSIGYGIFYSNSHSINKIDTGANLDHFDNEFEKKFVFSYSLKIGFALNKKGCKNR